MRLYPPGFDGRTGGLGRRPPSDDRHESLYPLRAVLPQTVASVERTLRLPYTLRVEMDQGSEGACVGYALTWMMAILNLAQKLPTRYMPFALYKRAQQIDEWPGSDYDGTSVRAGCDALRDEGHTSWRKVYTPDAWHPRIEFGITANRWASTIDEVRTAIALGIPVTLGINWYSAFDAPLKLSNESWIGRGDTWGRVRGGHAICVYAASDRRQAVKLVNSWGMAYPLVWLPYHGLERLLREQGEAVVVTDR